MGRKCVCVCVSYAYACLRTVHHLMFSPSVSPSADVNGLHLRCNSSFAPGKKNLPTDSSVGSNPMRVLRTSCLSTEEGPKDYPDTKTVFSCA